MSEPIEFVLALFSMVIFDAVLKDYTLDMLMSFDEVIL